MSRLHPTNSIEGSAAISHSGSSAGGLASRASERHSLVLFRTMGNLLLRLLRKTFVRIKGGEAKVAQSIYLFIARFLFSTALGGHTPLVEMVLNPKNYQALQQETNTGVGGPIGPGGGPRGMPMMMGGVNPMLIHNSAVGPNISNLINQSELHSPRALLLILELLAEYPVSSSEFQFLLPTFQATCDVIRRLLRSEKNLELALDAGIVKSLLWCALRPAASHETAEQALTSLLATTAKSRTSSEDLRLWLNAVLSDYSSGGLGGGQEESPTQLQLHSGMMMLESPRKQQLSRIEARRLRLLRMLVDVANGLAPSPTAGVEKGKTKEDAGPIYQPCTYAQIVRTPIHRLLLFSSGQQRSLFRLFSPPLWSHLWICSHCHL